MEADQTRLIDSGAQVSSGKHESDVEDSYRSHLSEYSDSKLRIQSNVIDSKVPPIAFHTHEGAAAA
jgi:hypothetical protein